jgi:predicted GH43/DUF377 family glycosyl hydrolase
MTSSAPASKQPRVSRRAFLGGAAVAGSGALVAAGLTTTALGQRVLRHIFGATAVPPAPRPTLTPRPASQTWPWSLDPKNPLLDVIRTSPWEMRAVFDPCVARQADGSLWMWYTTRGTQPSSIALAIDLSGTGSGFVRYAGNPVLTPDPPENAPATALSRPSVVALPGGGWRMWYSTNSPDGPWGKAWIGTATSSDGIHWQKHGAPVLTPQASWEQPALQCPNVLYDAPSARFMMWYCGGQVYEPDAVGFATSHDGLTWTRSPANPIFKPSQGWEGYKVGSFQVHRVGAEFYAFYNAFQNDPFVSQIGMARSADGITNWEHHPANPLITPGPVGSWNAAMVYKPSALWDATKQRWDVWFNASRVLNSHERIGHAWSDRIW